MPRMLFVIALLLGTLCGTLSPAARASVVVICNRAATPVTFRVDQAVQRTFRLAPGDMLPIAVLPNEEPKLLFKSGKLTLNYGLELDACYYFHDTELKGINLQQIGIPNRIEVNPTDLTAAMTDDGSRKRLPSVATIPVKLVVDDDERRSRPQWESVLRKRIESASKVFERTCRIRFEVVAVGTWESDDKITDFNLSMAEFEHTVLPNPARLVIGFTSQYDAMRGLTMLGGTRGAFYPYILLREWSQFLTEAERLEVLTHEMAHYLGAVHSAESQSVMRPMLGDRQARMASFRVGFDPPNALALYLIGEEYRAHGNLRKLTELSLATRRKLFNIYSEIGRTLGQDPAAAQYLLLLGDVSHESERVRRRFKEPEFGN